jgi:hypothetical protein
MQPVPSFNAYTDVRLLLQTRSNRLNPYNLLHRNISNIQSSPFNREKPTRILVHGWQEDATADISTETSAELLNVYDFNV